MYLHLLIIYLQPSRHVFQKEQEKRLDSPERSDCGSPDDSYVSVKTFVEGKHKQKAKKALITKRLKYGNFLKVFFIPRQFVTSVKYQ